MNRHLSEIVRSVGLLLIALFCMIQCKNTGVCASRYNPKRFDIHKGINLGNCYEAENVKLSFIDSIQSKKNLDMIKALGFDHVRIPISEENLYDVHLKPKQEYMSHLHETISYCHFIGLKTILDLHVCRVHHFNDAEPKLFKSEANKKAFLKVWKTLQRDFKKYSNDSLAYECLNEPKAPIDDHKQWNAVLNEWISLVRKTEKKRFLVVGSNRGYQLWTYKHLDIPMNDPYLILTFHYYQPNVLTHFKTNWSSYRNYNGQVHYPGMVVTESDFSKQDIDTQKKLSQFMEAPYDRERMHKEFQEAIKIAKKYNLQLTCTEFGCQRTVLDKYRYDWFKDIVSTFNENEIPYTLWSFSGAGFGVWKYDKKLDKEMVRLLTQEDL